MGDFSNGADPRRNKRPDASGINRGVLPPGTVNTDHVPTRGVGLDQLHLGPADYCTDPTTRTYSVHAQSNPLLAGQWSPVGNAYQLQAYLGAIPAPLHVGVWGGFSWKNDNTSISGHTRSILGLYAAATDVYPTIWADNVTYRWLDADNHFYRIDTFARFIVPADGSDWRIGMLHQFNADGDHVQNSVRDVSLMSIISAYDPNAIPGGNPDAPL